VSLYNPRPGGREPGAEEEIVPTRGREQSSTGKGTALLFIACVQPAGLCT